MSQFKCRLMDASFPPELLLGTIEQLPFGDGSIITNLSKIHPRIRSILGVYQRSITSSFVRKELQHAPTDFPRAPEWQGYRWLRECVKRYDLIDDVMTMLVSDLNCCRVEKHNISVVNTGLLLLYRLDEIEPHSAKLTFVKSLPQDPLTAIYLTINHATLTARYHGTGLINQRTYGHFMDANALSLRCDIEFSFAEGCLELGPSYIHSTLLSPNSAETALLNLYHDHATHDWDMENLDGGGVKPPVTQGPQRDPARRQRSLWTVLLERLAELVECPLEEVRGRIEEGCEAKDHSLAMLGLWGKERLVSGLDMEYVDV
ncbi:hypothetical protein K458DRAFT_438741 [Lentithecium fluviatile CBS 122367]|uniref:Uncharacterized protein n=1 Tax=Lentithecium fluviatile CBS 122367 TaxID=1168545 RepID=A0A6G1JLK7_9PLEO|nr:hypothetical protein K458DRAFT_438741 [Lentithecium fluviatile CBS 122367]